MNYPPTSMTENVLTTASYAAGTSSLNSGPTNIFSWAHTVPTYMPWATKQVDFNADQTQSSVVRFTAPQPCTSQTATTWELLYNLGTSCNRNPHTSNQHLKRRSDPDDGFRPNKQYISEERMAAKFGQLHISNDAPSPAMTTTNSNTFSNLQDIEGSSSNDSNLLNSSDSEDSLDQKKLTGRITLSDELKKIIGSDSFIVKSLVKEMTKPNMAVVLWQPPGGSMKDLIKQTLEPTSSSSETNNTTNTSAIYTKSFSPSVSSMVVTTTTRGRRAASFDSFFPENNNNIETENLNLVRNQRSLECPEGFTQQVSQLDDEEMEL